MNKKLKIWGLLPVLGICSVAVLLISLSALASYVQGETRMEKSSNHSTHSSDFYSENDKTTSLIKVQDTNGRWESVQDINIFDNSIYGNMGIIAPGTEGAYNFNIENIMDNTIWYQISIQENKDTENVSVEYRLKNQDSYILGNEEEWVDLLALQTEKLELPAGELRNIQLEWRWAFENGSDETDTIAGKEAVNGIGNYQVHILILAECEEPSTEEPPTEVPPTEAPPTEPSQTDPKVLPKETNKQDPPEQNQTNSSQVSAVKTGDEAAVIKYLVLLLCGSGLFIISIKRKKLKG